MVQGKHLEELVTNYIPFGLHGVNLKPPSDCRKTWSDVGGLSEAKRLLKETLEWPTQVVITIAPYKKKLFNIY